MVNNKIFTQKDRKKVYFQVLEKYQPEIHSASLIAAAIKSEVPRLIKNKQLHKIDPSLLEAVIMSGDFSYDLSYYILAYFNDMPISLKDAIFNNAAFLNLDDEAIFEFLSDPRYLNWKGTNYCSAWYHKVLTGNREKYASLIERSALTAPLINLLIHYQSGKNLDYSTEHHIQYIGDLLCSTYIMSNDLKEWTIKQIPGLLASGADNTGLLAFKKIYSSLFPQEEKVKARAYLNDKHENIIYSLNHGSASTQFFIKAGLSQEEAEAFYNDYPQYHEQIFHCLRHMKLHVHKDWFPEYLKHNMSLKYVQPHQDYGAGINLYLIHQNLEEVLTPNSKRALKIKMLRYLRNEYHIELDENIPLSSLISVLENTLFVPKIESAG